MQPHLQAGLRYVPDQDVVAQAAIRFQLLKLAPPMDCTALAAGTMMQELLPRLLNVLDTSDPTALHAYFTFWEKVLTASLSSTHDKVFSVSESDESAVWDAFKRVQPPEVTDRFWQVVN